MAKQTGIGTVIQVDDSSGTARDISDDITNYDINIAQNTIDVTTCLLYTSPSPRDLSTSRMPSSA